MHLSSFAEDLSHELLTALESLGVASDVDLLFSSGSPLDIWRRLPPSLGMSLHDFDQCVQVVLAKASAPGVTGDIIYNEAPPEHHLIVGVPKLDALLHGLTSHRVLEISGETGSGKSNLALQVICHYLCNNPTASALWIDTTGDFSPSRAATILSSCTGHATSTVLERLQVALAFDTESAYNVLESINHDAQNPVGCIVIDAITPLIGPDLSAVSSEGHALMVTFVRQLRSIAQAHNLSVLVINTTTSTPDGIPNTLSNFVTTTRKPALGPTFAFLVDATLWLARTDHTSSSGEGTVYVAEVFKSRSTETRKWCMFRISGGLLVET